MKEKDLPKVGQKITIKEKVFRVTKISFKPKGETRSFYDEICIACIPFIDDIPGGRPEGLN